MSREKKTEAKAAPETPFIELVGLRKTYTVGSSPVKALDGADLAVRRGEFVCLAGRSGSGNSTMLNMIAGLEPPTAGEILIEGRHVERMREEQRTRFRRKYVGFVFQSYNNLPQFTALENVALPLAIRGMGRAERTKLAKEALCRVGLGDHLHHKPSQLSGGQQQRVSIARAIVTQPPIVLADEPTGNLDSHIGTEIIELLCSLFRENGTTFIMSSHDPVMASYMDRTVRMSDGRIETEEETL
ncbi:MAG: ABC transporter ATP-binding protein [Oscillospiraceae bacterium]|nr:ABC transporter ATP-binding protein [Oscillospiraceae bacterium]